MTSHDLYFIASNGEKRLVAENVSYDEATKKISEFLKERNFISCYTRIWQVDEGVMFDIGSHTEFFLWEGYRNLFMEGDDD